jgi:hypothetical protein
VKKWKNKEDNTTKTVDLLRIGISVTLSIFLFCSCGPSVSQKQNSQLTQPITSQIVEPPKKEVEARTSSNERDISSTAQNSPPQDIIQQYEGTISTSFTNVLFDLKGKPNPSYTFILDQYPGKEFGSVRTFV